MQQKRNTCLAFPGRVSRAFSLLLLLLLCGTASAELVYTVESKDYSIGRVNYDAGGLPQNETVLKDIKASGLYFNEVFSTDQGEWRVLTRTSSSDSTFTLSLYDPDKDWKNPLAKAENLRGYIYYQDDSSLYLVSEDYPSCTVSKVDKKTLAVTRGAETLKGWPDFGYLKSDGIIYSRYDGEKQSLTVLDKDLKGKTFALDAGNYDYPISLGDGSLATTFVSNDVREDVDSVSISSSTSTLKDIGIFRFTPSAKTRIVTSADLGFSASDVWGSIERLRSDEKGGLYFLVYKSGASSSSTLYHWDGSKPTPVYKAGEGESIATYALDGSGNIYCSVSKSVRNEQTQTSTVTTSLYRVGTSTPVYTETYTGTKGTEPHLRIEDIQSDNSGNVYFKVYKSTSSQGDGHGPTSAQTQSYALYRCGASATTATKLHEETDGSWINYFWVSSSSSSVSVSGGSEDGPRFYDDSGNVYFTVSKYTQDAQTYDTTYTSYALYRCGTSQTTATKLYGVTDGSVINFAGMDDSNNVYFTVPKRARDAQTGDTTYTSSALYRCGTSQTTPDKIHEVKDSFIRVSDVSEAGSKGVYFAVVKEAVEKVEVGKEVEVAESEAGHYIIERYYYPSYAFYHYDGSDVTTIHTFSNVVHTDRRVDEKHKALYLYAEPFVSQDVAVSSQDVAVSSTLLAFDNTDRHNPEKVEEFEVAGTIGSVALYNHIEEPSSEESDVVRPQPSELISEMTEEEKKEATNTAINSLRSGGNEEAAKAFENNQIASDEEMRSAITRVSETQAQTLKENATSEMVRQGRTVRGDTVALGTMKFENTRLVFLSITLPRTMQIEDLLTFFKNVVTGGTVLLAAGDSDAVVFLNSSGAETKVVPPDYKVTAVTVFEGGKTYQPIVVASTGSGGGGSSSGGCDAGFGALALALMAGALLKKHSK